MNNKNHSIYKVLISAASVVLLLIAACSGKQDFSRLTSCVSNPPSGMACVPGGYYTRGSLRESRDEESGKKIRDESPEMKVWVDDFYIDIYEVTFAEYQECVKIGKCAPAKPNYTGYSRPRMPMLGVNWFHARDYCAAMGKRLPTEAEWEKAAKGPDGLAFPTGNNPPDCTNAVIQEKGKKGCGTGTTIEVGTRKPTAYGLYDMAGNSWEWVNDWYSDNYTECGEGCAGKNPKGPCGGDDNCKGRTKRIVRGGSWWWDAEYAASTNRRPHFPINKPFHHYGFRCAKSAAATD